MAESMANRSAPAVDRPSPHSTGTGERRRFVLPLCILARPLLGSRSRENHNVALTFARVVDCFRAPFVRTGLILYHHVGQALQWCWIGHAVIPLLQRPGVSFFRRSDFSAFHVRVPE